LTADLERRLTRVEPSFEIECRPGLTAKLFKLRDLGLDLTHLDWLVHLRNSYIHDCRIYAGYKVGLSHRRTLRLQLRASGPEVVTSGPPLAPIDTATLRAYADDLVNRVGGFLGRSGVDVRFRKLQRKLALLPRDPHPELSEIAQGGPDDIVRCVGALNERSVGEGLRSLLGDHAIPSPPPPAPASSTGSSSRRISSISE
jgi:hypothetical protein